MSVSPHSLEQLLALLPDAHVLLGPDGALLAANAAARRLIPAGHHALRVLATAAVPPAEFSVVTPGGERRVLDAQVTILDGEYRGLRLARLRDISSHREQELDREQALHVLEEIFDALPASVVVIDGIGRIVAANARWRVTAREHDLQLPDDGIGANYLDVCDAAQGPEAEEARVVAQGIRDVLAHRALAFEREYLLALDGRMDTFRLQVTALEGTPGAVIMHTDVSAIRLEQRAHGEALARFQAVFDQALDAMLLLDPSGVIRSANAASTLLFGVPPGGLIGRRLADYIPPSGDGELRELERALGDRRFLRCALHVRRADGADLDVECSARAQVVPGQDLVVLRNMTEQHQLEEQLRQAQKMEALGQLTGGIAHDFNNLLTVVQGNADDLLQDPALDLPPSAKQSLTDVLSASTRGAEMVRKLMAFGRKDQIRRDVQRIDVLVRDMAKLIGRLLPESIRVLVETDAVVPPVPVDASALQQILFNLATNSRDAMQERDGEFRLLVRVREGPARELGPVASGTQHVEVRVRDTGSGMRDDVLRRVFEPFFTTKPLGTGTGLGMAMVYGLMQQHEGSVDVLSRPGVGTSVILRFPVAPEPETISAGDPDIPAAVSGVEHILLVEDDRAIRVLAARVLREAGYRVTEADSGHAARACLAHAVSAFDLVVSDVVMPDGGGSEVAQAVDELAPELSILWVTGYATDGIPRRAPGTRGRRAILQKPWKGRDLLRAVRGELDLVARLHGGVT